MEKQFPLASSQLAKPLTASQSILTTAIPATMQGTENNDLGEPALKQFLQRAADECQSRFGFSELRRHQEEVLRHVFAGRDCLGLLPTGSGKSLCYALPALLRPGLVLVVSPLIALIRDQTRRFLASGIGVASLDSLQTSDEKGEVWQRLTAGKLKLLLVSPERLARRDFRQRLRDMHLQLVAIDEAHCISHWGSHFRPDYRLLGDYLADLGPVQKLALTATATSKVREDIIRTLSLVRPEVVWADFARANLGLKVVKAAKVSDLLTTILQLVLAAEGAGIVYVPTRKSAREVFRMLKDAGANAYLYHAGLSPAERQATQLAFVRNQSNSKRQVVVATHAFGMGIDKSDIRFVHHAGMPGNLEQYVQEIGRAGRDGLPAQCTLVYGPRDYYIHKFMIDKNYPELALMQDVLAHTRAHLRRTGGIGVAETGLLNVLRSAIDADISELDAAIQVLCREGLLDRLRALNSGEGYGDDSEVLISEGNPLLDEDLWQNYPLRKLDAMARLDDMRSFVTLCSADRRHFLDEYFRR